MKNFAITFFSLLILIFCANTPVFAQNTVGDDILIKGQNTAGTAGYSYQDVTIVAGNIINISLLLLGSVFLALMVYGGYVWLTAQGKSDRVEKAKDTIISASIGIVIVLAAYSVTFFIISQATKATSYEAGFTN